MNFFTSDIHFSDIETMMHEGRPFKSIKHYDKYIVSLWNKMMDKNDTLYVIGDLLDSNTKTSIECWLEAFKFIKKVKANIVLIIGNNEQRIIKRNFQNNFEEFRQFCLNNGIKDVKRNEKLSFGGYNFYLTHEPKNSKSNYINLVGHLHRTGGLWFPLGLNMACDLNYFKPFSEHDILFQLKQKAKYFKDKNYNVC